MSHEDTHRQLHRMFDDREFDAMDAHMSESIEYEDVPRGVTMKNRDEFKDWAREWVAGFSDARVGSATYHSGPDFSLARFHGRGRNDGEFGPFPASGAEMDSPFWELLRYDADGTVTSGAIHYDQMTILTQLGHIQPPG